MTARPPRFVSAPARRVCGRTRGQARARRRGRAGRRPSGADLSTNVGRGLALELGLQREEGLRDGLLGVAETAEQGDARRQAADHEKHPGAAERAAAGRSRRPPKGRARRNGLHPASETHHGRQRMNTLQASRARRVHVAARMSQRVVPPQPRLTPGGPSPSGVYADVIILWMSEVHRKYNKDSFFLSESQTAHAPSVCARRTIMHDTDRVCSAWRHASARADDGCSFSQRDAS